MTVGRITLLQHHSWIDCIPGQSTRLLLSFQDKMRYFFSLQDRAAFFNREVRLVKRKIKLSFSKSFGNRNIRFLVLANNPDFLAGGYFSILFYAIKGINMKKPHQILRGICRFNINLFANIGLIFDNINNFSVNRTIN